MKVAKKMQDLGKDVHFAVASKEDFGNELSEHGLVYKDTPVVTARDAKDQKFVMKEAFRSVTIASSASLACPVI